MYTMIESNGNGEIFYQTPCGEGKHIATVLDIGTGDARIMLDPSMQGKPIVPNMLKNIVNLLDERA